MGITALVCASLCAFFLKEPKGSFAEDYEVSAEQLSPTRKSVLAED